MANQVQFDIPAIGAKPGWIRTATRWIVDMDHPLAWHVTSAIHRNDLKIVRED